MTQRLLPCLVLVAAGCLDSEPEEVGTTTGEVSVTWTNLVGVTASGSDLSKTASTSAWDAGAVSVDTLASDGYVELTVGETGTNKAAGLSSGDGGQHHSDIDFALRFTTGGAVQVYEGGVLRGSFGTYAAGQRFRVEVEGGVVTYSRSGQAPFYTSAGAPSFPLLVDTALYTPGATINDVELVATGLTWQNVIGVAVSGDSLTKTAGTTGWNAGASSVQSLAGDGFVEFAVADSTTARAAGLSSGDSDQSYTDIDYGLRLNANGVVYVYEAGVLRGNFGSYLAGDRFRVEVAGGVVRYSRNGGPAFYTSAVPPTFPLGVDTSFNTPGATLNDFALVEAANACPAYDGAGPVCSGSWTINNASDLADVVGCGNITGHLTINAPGMSEIALPALERIGGNLTVTGNTDMARLRLPALKEIGGTTDLDALAVTDGVDLSSLRTSGTLDTRVRGTVEMAYPCLDTSGTLDAREWNGSAFVTARVHVPRLRQVVAGGFVSAHMNAPLLESVAGSLVRGDISAPSLTTVGGDVSSTLARVARVDAPNLTDVGGTVFLHTGHDLPALERIGGLTLLDEPTVDLSQLVSISGALLGGSASNDSCNTNGAQSALVLPALETAGAIRLCWDGLEQVSLPQLQVIGNLAINGNTLFIRSPTLAGPIEFPALTLIRGNTTMYVPANFPVLPLIRGSATIYAPASFPVLESIRGNLYAVASLDLPALVEVGNHLRVLVPIAAPSLLEVGGELRLNAAFSADNLITVGNMLKPNAGAVSLPSLTSVDGIVASRDEPVSLDLPALTQVVGAGAGRYAGSVVVLRSGMTSISMPALSSIPGSLSVTRNAALTSLDFAALTSLGPSLEINRNSVLPNCYATDIHEQLLANGWTGIASIYGNNGTGTCP